MKIHQRKISELIPAEYNPRYISADAFEHLKASLKRFEAVEPAIINQHPERKNIIVGGHQRLKAATSLGWDEFPCVYVELTRDQEKELNVRLNKNTGAFDFDLLANHFEVEELTDWGFSNEELFGDDAFEEPEAKEDDYEMPDEIETDIVLGDLIEIGEHRLLCGDSTDSDAVDRLMNGEKADMVFTDPPYGVDYEGINNDDRGGLEDLLRGAFSNMMLSTNNGGSFYCFHSDKCSDIFSKVYREFCHFSSMIIWVKESIVLSQTDYQSKHEPCMYGWFDNGTHKWYSDRKQESVWIAKSKKEEGHKTPKPIDIITKALNNSSKSGMSVLDLFLGSGSTMVASHQLKRKCYGMELDPKYCQVIIDRMMNSFPELKVKINGEKYGV
jgi:DNA modification methylase